MSDLEFIEKGDWPRYPFLPFTRSMITRRMRTEHNDKRCGFLIWGQGPVMFLMYIWDLKDGTGDAKKDVIDNPNVERIKYDSFQAILDDGWRID